MANYLLVANQTIGGSELREELRKRLQQGPSAFYVVVPRTRAHDDPAISTQTGSQGGAGSLPLVTRTTAPGGPATDAEAAMLAQHRLGELLEELRELGAEADGELGRPDPLRAVDEVLTSRKFDELIVSTLPQPVSKWLGMDLPHRLHRRSGLPATTVTARE